jgi:hypothetical protein
VTGAAPTTTSITGFTAAKRLLKPTGGRPPATQVIMATSRALLLFDGWNVPENDVLRHAEESARSLQQFTLAPSEPTLITASINLGRLVRIAPGIEPELVIPDAISQATVRTAGMNVLQCELTIPLIESAGALNHLPDAGAPPR